MQADSRIDIERTKTLLKDKLLARMPKHGDYPTPIPGFDSYRRDLEQQRENCFYKSQILVVVQGYKKSMLGAREYHFGEHNFLITGVDMPSASFLPEASTESPFLSMTLSLDKSLLAQLAAETPPSKGCEDAACGGVLVMEQDPMVLDAFLRLLELLDAPEQIAVLAPMLTREIHFRLLMGPYGGALRSLNTLGSQSNQVSRAVAWLRNNYKEPLLVENLAASVNMATSTFHKHFKALTSISPLQYQKRLRLYEAQRLMLAESQNAASAALAVGYESATQFSREYKRMFGEPPHRDVSARMM